MKKYLENLARRLIFWALQGRIRQFYCAYNQSDVDLVTRIDPNLTKFKVFEDLKRRIVDEMWQQGFIIIDERMDYNRPGRIYEVRINVVK